MFIVHKYLINQQLQKILLKGIFKIKLGVNSGNDVFLFLMSQWMEQSE